MKRLVRRRRPLSLAAAALALALVVAGCSFTGGGQLPGQNAPFATFAFSAVDTSQSHGNANVSTTNVTGNYQDGYVKFRFTGGYHSNNDPCSYVYFTYTSTNPFMRGSGDGYAYVCDYGEPNRGNDTLEIHITSGPYSQYSNSGPITNGNLKVNTQAP